MAELSVAGRGWDVRVDVDASGCVDSQDTRIVYVHCR